MDNLHTVDSHDLLAHINALDIALMGKDLAEASALLITFPTDDVTRSHAEAAGDYLFALARLEADPTAFGGMLLDSYRETYADSRASVVEAIVTPATVAQR